MDKQQTSREDVYEQYVDASVALFMKYYCDTLYDGVGTSDELSKEDTSDTFPAELDARCRSLIKKTMKRQRFQKSMRYTGKALRYLCSIAVVCLALASFLFISVDAVRVPIINYYIQHSDNNFLEITSNNHSTVDAWNQSLTISDPLKDIVPEEYSLIAQEGDSISNFSAIYKNAQSCSIFISARPLDDVTDIDLQNADNIQNFQIYNCEAIMAKENNTTRLIWIHNDISTTFTLILNGETDLDIVFLADQIIRKLP